ncbi:MAG: hypothetical protein ABL901_17445 [Hyphomicrobiaceae bacterium]
MSMVRLSLLAKILASLLLLCSTTASGRSEPLKPDPAAGHLLKRDVLALYDSADEPTPDKTRIHKFLEMPLNHLGYRLTYWDLKRGTPSPEITLKHAAAVSWFGDAKLANAAGYFKWAAWASRMKVKFVLFGLLGAPGTQDDAPQINELFAGLGLKYTPHYVSDTAASRLRAKDAFVEFERKLPSPLPGYLVMQAQGSETRAHLSVASPALSSIGAQDTVIVATSPGGGYVAANYANHYDPKSNRLSWQIDPIAFLSAALTGEPAPVPDTTTRAGRRIYFSHIDGDGWNNFVKSPPGGGEPSTAAEVAMNHLIVPYPDLPVSIGLISCDIDPALGGTTGAQDIARKLYALPQVEVASHTHTHPFEWSFFENYSRTRELNRINPPAPRVAAGQPAPDQGGLFDLFGSTAAAKTARAQVPVHAPPPGPLPRYRTAKPFDLGSEVAGSLQAAQDLAPKSKRAQLYLWSGDTRPFEAAVRATRKANVRNMNGGDTRYDSDYASLAYVRPLSRLIGRERQIYSVNANEMLYTNDWKGPYGGFAKLTETFERTENPRRLKAMNLYYHMYSAEKPDGLEAVRGLVEYARAANVIPVEASRYAAIADDFFQAEIRILGPMKWRIEKRGEMQTMRFDAAASLTIDYAASAGILGHNRHADALYVSLDPAAADPVVALKASSGESTLSGRAHLIESRWDVHDLKADACALSAKAKGYGPGQMRWAGLKPGPWRINLQQDGQPETTRHATADASGNLTVSLDADARPGLNLEMRCEG